MRTKNPEYRKREIVHFEKSVYTPKHFYQKFLEILKVNAAFVNFLSRFYGKSNPRNFPR